MANIVFILGAGCSLHAGAPLMADFLDRAREIHTLRGASDRETEFQLVFDVIGGLQRVHSKAQIDLTNIESIFSAFDIAQTLRKLPGCQEPQIDDAVKALQWLIVRTLETTMTFPVRGRHIQPTDEYERFAEMLRDLGGRKPALSPAVITFNYDVGIDIALNAFGVPFTYALAGDDSRVPLLKLHGSLNWAKMREQDDIEPWSIRDYVNRYTTNFSEVTKVQVPIATHMADALKDRLSSPMPVIVPPTWNKGGHQRQLWRVWQRAARELGTATHVVVIGYSLPETDQFFKLLYGLGSEGPNPLQAFYVMDPTNEVESRFRAMLGAGALARFRFFRGTFGQSIDSLRSVLGIPFPKHK